MKINIFEIKKKFLDLDLSEEDKKLNSDSYTPASVLIPLYEKNGATHVLFTKRTDKVRDHKGQISFPGGKFDSEDINLEKTALRETFEEVGIKEKDVTVIGKINNMITITNYIVSPFVGYFNYPYVFNVNHDEIAELIEVPLFHLFDKKNFKAEERRFLGINHKIYYFYYKEYVIWGVTGKIMYDFLKIFSDF